MLNITILEGGRGTGKSTVAFKLRQMMSETTLMNPTGFHNDGEEGLNKVVKYYDALFGMLNDMSSHDSKIVFDRFYFSEEVFSSLYKSYDFSDYCIDYNQLLADFSSIGVKIDIVLLTINDEEELKRRLVRDKVPFGNVEESVKETLNQQAEYVDLLNDFHFSYKEDNLKVHFIDTSRMSSDDVYNEILKLKTT